MGQIKVKDLMERVAKAGGPNFRKLKGWRDGYVVGISACVGSDCSRTQELAKELDTFGYEFIGPTISRWEGSEEQGFLVHAEVEGQVRHLIALGTVKYGQSDVYGWKLPLADTDIIIKTDSNGTELDGTMYEIVAPIALSVKDLGLTKGITEGKQLTRKEFIGLYEGRIVHCPTEQAAEDFLRCAEGFGYQWATGDRLTENSFYDNYLTNTYYFLEDHGVKYGNISKIGKLGPEVIRYKGLI